MTLITDAAPAASAAAAPAAPAAGTPADGSAAAAGANGETAQAGANDANSPAGNTGEDGADGGGSAETDQQKAERIAAEAAAAEAAKAAGAPEKYEAFVAPEGTALDSAVMTQFEEAARELNLPQDKAQQLIDKMAPAMAQQQAVQMQQLSQEWQAAATADKEYGGDKLAENLGYATKAVDTFASPELKTMLRETGLGNHPELVRFMVRAGKAISEDKIVTGGAPASANRSAAEVLYGGTAKK